MARPTYGYHDAAGNRLPGASTIAGLIKPSGGLVHWAWQLGMDGKDYREQRDTAADIGTIAHQMVEDYVRGHEFNPDPYPPEQLEAAQPCFDAFMLWAENTKMEVVTAEETIVSEKERFGGTMDALLLNGKHALGDWKTSNATYGEYLLQLAGYAILFEEAHPDIPLDGGFHIIRFSKETGDFHHHGFPQLSNEKIIFRKLVEIHHLMKGVRKRAK